MNVRNDRLNIRAASLNLLTAILWGGNSVSIKLALAGIPPLCLAGVRFFLGGLVVLIWAKVLGLSLRLHPNERKGIAGLVLIFLTQIYLLNAGTAHTLASRSTIFISAYPFFTTLFAHFFIPNDRISSTKITGMVLAFGGVISVFAESLVLSEFQYLFGDVLVLCSAMLLGARQIYLKRLTQNMHPGKVLIWQALPSLPIFFALSALIETQTLHIDMRILSGVLYQGLVVAGFCFILLTSLLQRYSASRLAVFGFITPVIGVIISNQLLGDPISPGILLSLALVGAGITIVNRET
ncbi:MAG: drug/metabolite transporter (DMT)-like permease [Candidatus Latescibacterota bacterium]|jgi:drug/metabolite transporter (DMT)-like permease